MAKAKILANSELFFKSGSDINLTCVAQHTTTGALSYIYWYKDNSLINYSQRGGINVLTERLTKTSKLQIARVVPSDSGNYTCTPSNSSKYINTHTLTLAHTQPKKKLLKYADTFKHELKYTKQPCTHTNTFHYY